MHEYYNHPTLTFLTGKKRNKGRGSKKNNNNNVRGGRGPPWAGGGGARFPSRSGTKQWRTGWD
eukprot:653506-Amorphochlora_amoeboformis.AAC.1